MTPLRTHQSLLGKIKEELSRIIIEVELSTKSGTFGSADSENVYRQILNIVYSWNLESANNKKSNAPGIDLYDTQNKVLVQVTAQSDNLKHKLKSSLEKIPKEYKNEEHHFYFLLIAKDADNIKKSNLQEIPDPKNYGVESINILDNRDIIRVVSGKDVSILRKLANFLDREINPDKTTELGLVIRILANQIREERSKENIHSTPANHFPPGIQEKIIHNNLEQINSLIKDYAYYANQVEYAYNTCEQEADTQRADINHYIRDTYHRLKKQPSGGESTVSSVEIFYNIIEKLNYFIKDDPSIGELKPEQFNTCITAITVHAFMACKIFEPPPVIFDLPPT